MEVASGSNGTNVESLLGNVADEFTDRLNRGERPDIEDYANRYPQLAELLRQILPALQLIGVSGADPVPGAVDDPWPKRQPF